MVRTKICSRCGDEKPITAFHLRDDSPDGHRGVCKDCINASLRAARWKRAHPVEPVRAAKESAHAPKPKSTIECIVAAIRRRLGL